MTKVLKTSLEEEQREKDERFLELTPFERWEQVLRFRELMRKPGVNYSYDGLTVKITRLSK